MKSLLVLLALTVMLAACSSGSCPSGYSDPNWCNQPAVGGDM